MILLKINFSFKCKSRENIYIRSAVVVLVELVLVVGVFPILPQLKLLLYFAFVVCFLNKIQQGNQISCNRKINLWSVSGLN